MQGADIVQLRQFGQQVGSASTELETIAQRLSSQLTSTVAWRGNDAAQFKSQWSSEFRPNLHQAARMLADSAKALERNANEQEQASEANGGGSGGVTGGGGGGVGGKPGGSSPGAKALGNESDNAGILDPISPFIDLGKTAGKIVTIFLKIKKLTKIAKWANAIKNLSLTSLEYLRNARRIKGVGGATGVFGKVFAGLAIVGGINDMINPEHDGLRGVGDRVAGGLSVVSGVGTIALGFAPVAAALGPVGAAIIVGAGVVAGAWAVGNMIYDNREAIAGFFKDPGGYISDGWNDLKKGTTEVISNVGDKLSDAGDWVKDKWKGLFG